MSQNTNNELVYTAMLHATTSSKRVHDYVTAVVKKFISERGRV